MMVIAPATSGTVRYSQTDNALSLFDNFGLFGRLPPQDIQLMAESNIFGSQLFRRAQAVQKEFPQKPDQVHHGSGS